METVHFHDSDVKGAGEGGRGGPKSGLRRSVVLGEAILCMETSREMCQGKRSCPVSGKIRGDVSGEKKLSSQWENQGRCVRGKEAVQAVGNSMGMCQGKRLQRGAVLGDTGTVKEDVSWENKAVQPMGISKETCQGKRNCPVSGKLNGDVSGEKSGGP